MKVQSFLLPGVDIVATAGDAWFDVAEAERVIGLFTDVLGIELSSLETAIIVNLFAWHHPDGRRRWQAPGAQSRRA